jgi:hypothetical protein
MTRPALTVGARKVARYPVASKRYEAARYSAVMRLSVLGPPAVMKLTLRYG